MVPLLSEASEAQIVGQDFELGQVVVVVHALGRQISVSSRPAWSAEPVA